MVMSHRLSECCLKHVKTHQLSSKGISDFPKKPVFVFSQNTSPKATSPVLFSFDPHFFETNAGRGRAGRKLPAPPTPAGRLNPVGRQSELEWCVQLSFKPFFRV